MFIVEEIKNINASKYLFFQQYIEIYGS